MFEEIVLPVIAAVLAGLGWSTVGIWSRWRSGIEAQVDLGKLKKNIVIGTVIGIVTWGYSVAQGDIMPILGTVELFIGAVAAYFPIIVIVDKLLIRKDPEDEFEDDE